LRDRAARVAAISKDRVRNRKKSIYLSLFTAAKEWNKLRTLIRHSKGHAFEEYHFLKESKERMMNKKLVLGSIVIVVAVLLLSSLALIPAISFSNAASVSSRCEPTYANGQDYCMNAPHVITNPNPNLLAQAQILYLVAYMPLPPGCDTSNPSTCLPETLPSGYMPQCNPCFHGGALNNFPYHDHVVEGAPGSGTSGTAGVYKGPWDVIIVVYNPAYSFSTTFTPFKSVSAVQAGEAAGDFLPINLGAANPYEINTGVVLICPLVQQNS
jgi:hypothetical protein